MAQRIKAVLIPDQQAKANSISKISFKKSSPFYFFGSSLTKLAKW